MAELAAEGKIGALGVSNFAAWQIADVIHVAREVGAPAPVVAQQLYNLVARRVEEEYLEFAATHQVHTMVYNPLGGGLLTGKHSFEAKPSRGPLRRLQACRHVHPSATGTSSCSRPSTPWPASPSEAGITLAELSLRWLAYRNGVGSMLLGGSKVEQLQANIAAVAKGPLPDDVTAACDAVGAGLRGPMPAYNR